MSDVLLSVRDLKVSFPTSRGVIRAVRGVSFDIERGESVGLVGESGCGKSTVLKSLINLVPPNSRVEGQVLFEGRDLLDLPEQELRTIRGGRLSMVFQDPVNVFNPAFTIGHQMRRALRLHRDVEPEGGWDAEILRMMATVGIDGRGKLDSYPFEFSQGQLQRLMIATACLSGQPLLLLADEPTTSLDVTIEAQILQLLRNLRRDLGLALVLVTHNLALVAELCDRVLVMYAGTIVEEADAITLFSQPGHPYTEQLLRSTPTFPHTGDRLYSMAGDVPDLSGLRSGCPFAPRCERHLGDPCNTIRPILRSTDQPGQVAACHLYPTPEQPIDVEPGHTRA